MQQHQQHQQHPGKRSMQASAKLLLAVILVAAMLVTACGSKSESGAGQNGSASNGGDEEVTLKVEIFDRGNTPAPYTISDSYMTRLIQDKFGTPNGIKLKFVPIQRSEETKKLNVLMSSGSDVPDIVFTYDEGTYYRYAQQGGLTDVTKLLDEHGPNLKKFLGEDTLKYGQINGTQFAVPGKRIVLGKYASYIRQDWLDKLGLPVPQTTDELYTTLKAFKEKDPGKLGGSQIPFGMAIAPAQYDPLLWSFIQPVTEEQRYTLTQKLGSSDYPVLLPGFKDGLKFLNKLYNEGLVSKDFGLDKDRTQMQQDIVNGKIGFYTDDAGVMYYGGDSTYKTLQDNVPGALLTPFYPFVNSEGKMAKPQYASNGLYVMIPKSSKHAVEAIKYLDWMTSEKNLFDLQNGVEGENYTLVDGIPVMKQDATQEASDRLYNYGDIAIIANGKFVGTQEQNDEAYVKAVLEPTHQEDMRKSVEVSNTDPIKPVVMDRPIEAESKYGSALLDKVDEMIVKTAVAKPDQFESTYQAMLESYMSSGGQAIHEERTKVYAEMAAK